MSTKYRRFRCAPEDVARVLGNGWLYASWVVGASRMRSVDDEWPAPGSKLHHSVGTWPLVLNDSTEVLEWEPDERMVLRARGWPIGVAQITIEIMPHEAGCLVRMWEDAVSGPAKLIPKPIRDLLLDIRNRETLHRLGYIAEGTRGEDHTGED